MPQVKNPQIVAGWYTNKAVDAQGQPRALSLGTVSFKPGQHKHVPAHLLAEARSTHDAFVRALAGGKLVADGQARPVIEKPVVVVETVVEPVTVTDDFKAVEVITAETPAPPAEEEPKAKKRRRVE